MIQSITIVHMPDPAQRDGYSELQWRSMSPRKVVVNFSIHNYGSGPVVQQMSEFTGEIADTGPPFIAHPKDVCPKLQSVGGDEKYIPSSLEAVFPGNQTHPLDWPIPKIMDYDNSTMRIFGCVAYRGPLDNGKDPRAIHTTEIETMIHTSPNDGRPQVVATDAYTVVLLAAD